MDPLDPNNAAVARHLRTPPSMLEEVEHDPKALKGWFRKLLLVNANAQHQALNSLTAPLGARQAFMDFLAKNGDTLPKATESIPGSGFSINIVFGSPGTPTSITNTQSPAEAEIIDIEATPVTTPESEPEPEPDNK